MVMYKRILVPLDGSKVSEQILPYAGQIAERFDIPLELLLVIDPDVRPPFWPPQPRRDYLREAGRNELLSSLRVEYRQARGNPAEVIVERAKADPHCLIAMATHGLTGTRRWFLGSVASKVVQIATNPVLLIRPTEEETAPPISIKTVFVPLDGSGLAEQVLPHVIALSKTMNLEVQLIRAYTLPPDAYVVGEGVYQQPVAQYRDLLHSEAENYLNGKIEQLRAYGLEKVAATAIEGDPAGVIIDLARRTPDNLIAMSTHGRSGVGRWLLGSIAEKVIHHSRDPVLIIRP